MIRSHESIAWYCCGTQWPKEYRYCGWCGRGVVTADRVLIRVPIIGGADGNIASKGEIAVVASAEPDAETWAMLAKTVELSAGAYARRAAMVAASGATNSPAGASVLAVDPSRSTPDAVVPEPSA